MEGASTPKAGVSEALPVPDVTRPRELRRDALHRAKRMSARDKFGRSESPNSSNGKDSSESGRESADTLRGDKDLPPDRKVDSHPSSRPVPNVSSESRALRADITQSIPIITVIAVAAVAGVLYYRSKE
jgi:hypothetical protein